MKLKGEDKAWFESVQDEFLGRLRPNASLLGEHLFHVPAKLPQSAVANGRLFANRVEALNFFPQGQTVAEVGTQAGWYAERMIDTIKPRELHLFDLDFHLLQTERPEIAKRPEVTLHEGDSSQKLAALPDKYFDLIYIDGDHEIVGVIKDTNVALEKVRDDGILVFNDYTPWSIMELNDYGVMPVVNDLLASGAWTVAYFAFHPHMYCDIAIRRI